MTSRDPRDEGRFALVGLREDGTSGSVAPRVRGLELGLGVTLLLLGTVVAFSFWGGRELTSATQSLASSYTLRQLQGDMRAAIGDAEFMQWGIALARVGFIAPGTTPPPVADSIAPVLPTPTPSPAVALAIRDAFTGVLEEARVAFVDSRAMTATDPFFAAQNEFLLSLEPLLERRLALFEEVVEATETQGPTAGFRLLMTGEGMWLTSQIHTLFDRMNEETRVQIDERLASAETIAARTEFASLIGLFLAVFLVVLIGAVVRRELAKRQSREVALRRSEEEINQFLDGMPLGVVVVNGAGRIVYTNQASEALLPTYLRADGVNAGGSVDEIPLYRRGTEERYPQDSLPVWQALSGLSASSDDLEIRTGNRTIPIHMSAEPIRDNEGRVAFVVATLADIGQQIEAREQLVRAKQMAEEASRAKSDFLARMSHELRTPLNSVIGFTNILLKNKHERLVSSDLFYLDRIQSSGRHLLDVINGILDLARIEAGRLEIQLSDVRVDTLASEALAGFEAQIGDRPIGLELVNPAGALTLRTDPLKFKQILINLIGNAVKFTKAGSISVRIASDPSTGAATSLAVQDTGMGIPTERLEAIFQAFEQVENGTDRRHDGTGLGLTITRALCEELGYRLLVESRLGEGSTFTVHFSGGSGLRHPVEEAIPAVQAPVAALNPGAAIAGFADRPLVLVVDDEEDARYLVLEMLKEIGCRTLSAASGREALALARTHRPDAITLDLLLGQERGLDLVSAIESAPDLRGIPILVVSIAADEVRGGIPGVAEVLQKPLDREELEAAIQRQVGVAVG